MAATKSNPHDACIAYCGNSVSRPNRNLCRRKAARPNLTWLRSNSSLFLLLLTLVACSMPIIRSEIPGEMVLIPAGSFPMGVSRDEPDDEGPKHYLYLDAFWIDIHEVTNNQYRLCVEANICHEPKDLHYYQDPTYADHPVVYITWHDAHDFFQFVDKRLPTEAEWEKAARGSQGWIYPWGDDPLQELLNADNRIGRTTPVGSYPEGASSYGALDMAGNVWEWVDDWFMPYPGSTYQSDIFGQKYKVVRGGSWNHPIEDARTDHRDIAHPERAMAVVGFRCAAFSH